MSIFSELVSYSNVAMISSKRQESPNPCARQCLSRLTRILDLDVLEDFQDTTKNVALNLEIGDGGEAEKSSKEGFFSKSSTFINKMISNSKPEKATIFGQLLTADSLESIEQLFTFLYKHVHTEGLFRLSGSKKRQEILRAQLDMGAQVNLLECGMFTAHDVATVLKQFIGELPEALLPEKHHIAHKQATELDDVEKYIKALQLLLLLLPPQSRILLEKTLQLLKEVADNKANKMTEYNLAVVFTPNILHLSHKKSLSCVENLQDNIDQLTLVIQRMIVNSHHIFKIPDCMRQEANLFKEGSLEGEEDIPLTQSSVQQVDSKTYREITQRATADALAELYDQVSKMPDGPVKTKFLDRFQKSYPGTPPFVPRSKKVRTGLKNSTPLRSNASLGPLGRSPLSPINSRPSQRSHGTKSRFMRPPIPLATPSGIMYHPSNMDIFEGDEENTASPVLKSPPCDPKDSSFQTPKTNCGRSIFYTPCFEPVTPTSSVVEMTTPSGVLATPSGVIATPSTEIYRLYGNHCKQAQRKTCTWDSETLPSPIKL